MVLVLTFSTSTSIITSRLHSSCPLLVRLRAMSSGATAGDPMLLDVNPRSSSDDCRDVYARNGTVSEKQETRGLVMAATVAVVIKERRMFVKRI